MIIKCLIADDEPAMRLIIKKTLLSIDEISESKIYEVSSGIELVEHVREKEPDVVFVDIDMPGLNGIEAAEIIHETNPFTFLIFATGYPEYREEAFKVYAYDYLVKPFDVTRIKNTMTRIIELLKQKEAASKRVLTGKKSKNNGTINKKIGFKLNKNIQFFNVDDIILVTKQRNNAIVHMVGHDPLSIREKLDDLITRLPDNFLRCHRSYIINLNYIEEISPWGHSHMVTLNHSKETALINNENMKKIGEILGGL
jgi:two-component system LytT family response regulator